MKKIVLRPTFGGSTLDHIREFIQYYENLLRDPSLELPRRRYYEACLADWRLDLLDYRTRVRGSVFDSGSENAVYTGNTEYYYTGKIDLY